MGKHISLRKKDALNQFWIQTRLLFSRTLFLLLAAMFALFSWIAFEESNMKEDEVFILLMMQSMVLAILLHMGLWEKERQGKTFELLIMRVANRHSLIWFKLRVSLSWTLALTLPFFAGYTWFFSVPTDRMALYFLFCQMGAAMAALMTCVVGSFVHRGLPAGIIAAILLWILAVMTEGVPLPYRDFYRPFVNPLNEKFLDELTLLQHTGLLVANRLSMLLILACMYWWFFKRLRKTEEWVA